MKLRPDANEPKDMAIAYITAIDTFAKALKIATKIISDGVFIKNLQVIQ